MVKITMLTIKYLGFLVVYLLVLVGAITVGNLTEKHFNSKNTEEQYPLYNKHDAVVQLPIMFTLNHDLVSDEGDMSGYCLSARDRDVECYTMQGRFIGVGSVELFSDGNKNTVFTIDKAPSEYRRIMTNAFLRVWAE